MMKKSNKKGFTLVELIVVIAIMAILAAVLVPTVTSKIKQANQSSANSEASSYANSIKTDIIALQSNISSSLDLLKTNSTPVTDGTNKTFNLGTTADPIYVQFDTTKMDDATDMKKDNTTFSSDGTNFKVSTTVGGATVEYTVTVDTANGGKITVSEPDYK